MSQNNPDCSSLAQARKIKMTTMTVMTKYMTRWPVLREQSDATMRYKMYSYCGTFGCQLTTNHQINEDKEKDEEATTARQVDGQILFTLLHRSNKNNTIDRSDKKWCF